jgi:hypothetical protein
MGNIVNVSPRIEAKRRAEIFNPIKLHLDLDMGRKKISK